MLLLSQAAAAVGLGGNASGNASVPTMNSSNSSSSSNNNNSNNSSNSISNANNSNPLAMDCDPPAVVQSHTVLQSSTNPTHYHRNRYLQQHQQQQQQQQQLQQQQHQLLGHKSYAPASLPIDLGSGQVIDASSATAAQAAAAAAALMSGSFSTHPIAGGNNNGSSSSGPGGSRSLLMHSASYAPFSMNDAALLMGHTGSAAGHGVLGFMPTGLGPIGSGSGIAGPSSLVTGSGGVAGSGLVGIGVGIGGSTGGSSSSSSSASSKGLGRAAAAAAAVAAAASNERDESPMVGVCVQPSPVIIH